MLPEKTEQCEHSSMATTGARTRGTSWKWEGRQASGTLQICDHRSPRRNMMVLPVSIWAQLYKVLREVSPPCSPFLYNSPATWDHLKLHSHSTRSQVGVLILQSSIQSYLPCLPVIRKQGQKCQCLGQATVWLYLFPENKNANDTPWFVTRPTRRISKQITKLPKWRGIYLCNFSCQQYRCPPLI